METKREDGKLILPGAIKVLQKKYYARLYEEAKRLADVVKKNVVDDKTEKVAGELLAYGPYKYLKRR